MSRIGKQPVTIPSGVKVSVTGRDVKVEGPKGKLAMSHHPMMKVSVEGDTVVVQRPDDSRKARSLHGLTRSLVNNMVVGVSTGFVRELDIQGVGYRAEVKGKVLNLTLGFSHPINYQLPEGVDAKVDDRRTHITLSSANKQVLGAAAAKIRSFRPPEPYGGKGVRYSDEVIVRKEGKSGAK